MAEPARPWLRLGGRTLLRVTGGSIEVFAVAGATCTRHGQLAIDVAPGILHVSAGGEVAMSWTQLDAPPRLWDLDAMRELPVPTLPPGRAAGLLALDARPHLVSVRDDLATATPLDGSPRRTARLRAFGAFRARDAVALGGDRVALLGRFGGDPFAAIETVVFEAGNPSEPQPHDPTDRAWDLEVGPCDAASAVVYRDPDGEEEPDQDPRQAFGGFYIVALDGRVTDMYPQPRVEHRRPICATARAIAAQLPGGLAWIDRADRSSHGIAATAVALDRVHRRFALENERGGLSVHHLDELGTMVGND